MLATSKKLHDTELRSIQRDSEIVGKLSKLLDLINTNAESESVGWRMLTIALEEIETLNRRLDALEGKTT